MAKTMKDPRYLTIPFLAVLLFAAGCSAGEYPDSADMDFSPNTEYEFSTQDPETEIPIANMEGRRLVKRVELSLRVEDLEKAGSFVDVLMEQYLAYPSSAVMQESSRNYVIRVPAISTSSFLSELSGIGSVLQRTESTEDVSLRYFDLEGRFATQRELLDTFRTYLGKANSIEEILSLETRIAQLQSELDGTGREIRNIADLVDYSTITLSLRGPVVLEINSGTTLRERIGITFSDFGRFMSALVVFLISLVIYVVPILLALALFYWLLFGKIGLLKKLYRLVAGKPDQQNP